MTSEIAENRRHEFISIHHLGFVEDGVDRIGGPTGTWTPSFENYSFREANGVTDLTVDMGTTAEYEEMFSEAWPRALAELKNICERDARGTAPR